MSRKSRAIPALFLLWTSISEAQIPGENKPKRPSAQVLKAGLRLFDQPDVVVSYEQQVTPRWSLLGSLGYFPQQFTFYGSSYNNTTSQYQPVTIQGLNSFYHADAQFRYYFRRKKPHLPLVGWYAAGVLHTSCIRTRETVEATPTATAYTTHTTDTRLQPQLHIGRQWALGKRLMLDTFVGTEVFRRASTTRTGRNFYQPLNKGLGVQLGARW